MISSIMSLPKRIITAATVALVALGGVVAYALVAKKRDKRDARRRTRTKRAWQVGIILSLLFALVANFVVGAQVLDLPSIGAISDKYATYLTPASYAFSIWSLIYVLLTALAVYQARDIVKPRKDNDLPARIGPLFVLSSIANGLWTYVFVNELVGLSVIILLVLAGSLYALLWRLNIATDDPPLRTIAFVWWPLMIYTGWVTVASVVNIASWLDSLGVTITPLIAVITLAVLTVFLTMLLVTRNVRELLLPVVWAFVAIGVQQIQGSQAVAWAVFIAAGLLTIFAIVHAYINRQSNPLGRVTKRLG